MAETTHTPFFAYRLDALTPIFEPALREFDRDQVEHRLWARDHTLWKKEPEGVAEFLGWLDLPRSMEFSLPRIGTLVRQCADFEQVVLLGMGGSSLGAETLVATMGGTRPLRVLDSTHPEEVLAIERSGDMKKTLFIAASKSGTTLETSCHLEYFYDKVKDGSQFIAITDPSTPLATLARERNFREVLLTPPDVGGRYSVLSYFGLVPAALAGVDVAMVLHSAQGMARACGADIRPEQNPGIWLGALLTAAVRAGRDKLTFHLPEWLEPFGPWLEQLLAESTGKEGTGIVPVTAEPPGPPESYSNDRLNLTYGSARSSQTNILLPWNGVTEIGAEFFRWEIATAAVGYGLHMNPFDQPEVESAKAAAATVLARESAPPTSALPLNELLQSLKEGDYVAFQAYLPRSPQLRKTLQSVRARLRDHFRVATTLEFGPRYLHSTGQLHKGGPNTVCCIQIVDEIKEDAPIPGKPFTYGRLITAQAEGDLMALQERGRRISRVTVDELLKAADSWR